MILTGLAPDPRRPDYRLVDVDRGRFASLRAADLADLDLRIGAEIPAGLLERLQELADLEAAHRAALRALARRGRGPARIIADLLAQGVDRRVAEEAVRAALATEGVDPALAVRILAAKRARQLAGLPPAVRKRRLVAFLVRRGFNGGAIREVVESLNS